MVPRLGWAAVRTPSMPTVSSNWLRLMRNPDAAAIGARRAGAPSRAGARPLVARRGREGVERPRCGTYNHPRRPDRLLGPSTASPHAVWKL